LAGGVTLGKDDQEGLVQLGLSFGTTLGATYGLKTLIDSDRPNGQGDDSFPSGHTSRSFSAAAYLDHRYGWRYGLPAYAIATFVAYSRVEADAHHVRDVAAGAVLAWGISHLFVDPKSNVTVEGEVSERRALLRLGLRW
jgi:membrane-associated phospholipid phosphatase